MKSLYVSSLQVWYSRHLLVRFISVLMNTTMGSRSIISQIIVRRIFLASFKRKNFSYFFQRAKHILLSAVLTKSLKMIMFSNQSMEDHPMERYDVAFFVNFLLASFRQETTICQSFEISVLSDFLTSISLLPSTGPQWSFQLYA